MSARQMYPDDLAAALELLTHLNNKHGVDSGPLWKYSARIQIENPEHGEPIGWAIWNGDGFWAFEPLEATR